MKIIILSLLLIKIATCEVPPPYPPRGFRPSQPLVLPARQPQTTYGAPYKIQTSPVQDQYRPTNARIVRPNNIGNNAFSIEPSRIIASGSWSQNSAPTTNFNRPQPQQNSFSSFPQQSYGPPKNNNNNFLGSNENEPEIIYGTPNRETVGPSASGNNQLQTSYGAPIEQKIPQTQYGVPSVKDIETLEKIRQLQAQYLAQLNARAPSTQYLPIKEPQRFRLTNSDSRSNINANIQSSIAQHQFLPFKDVSNFNRGYDSPQKTQIGSNSFENILNQKLSNQQYLPPKEPSYTEQQAFNTGIQSQILNQNQFNNIPKETRVGTDISNNQTPNQQYLPPSDLDLPRNRIPNFNSDRPGLTDAPTPQYVATQQDRPNTLPQSNFQLSPTNIQRFNGNRVTPQNEEGVQEIPVRHIYPTDSTDDVSHNNDGSYQGQHPRDQKNPGVTDTYLPPATTPRSEVTRPTRRPSKNTPTEASKSNDDKNTTESEDSSQGPNIAVATAVAGLRPQQPFYLVQPDGHLQRIVYQGSEGGHDSQEDGGYRINYLFQNMEQDPNLVYAPIVIGKRSAI